ncbi:MAG TPA: hypothetical protein IGS53_08955 [Leptolyngbyaceae cyanobacterium M33_DOE_097]|uniref:Uncharacterized protein n=1 Tax=Oscillatoriales cyanobacterium SpSt-418 TaxID=2282169 RepID=A0A7C3KDC0_9CYAN|nr:hypothetical protein [Leptolyngbyaceae cyanobacterium M33_DOE_097]
MTLLHHLCLRRVSLYSWLAVVSCLLLTSCMPTSNPSTRLQLKLHQKWQLQPGDRVAGYAVLGGLGDITIGLNRAAVYAPFNGRTQKDSRNCIVFSSPDVPAYLFRLCGLEDPRVGTLNAGDRIGRATTLEFAALRKQPNGTWAIVEPSRQILERTLKQP